LFWRAIFTTIECKKVRTGAAVSKQQADDALADLRFIGYDALHRIPSENMRPRAMTKLLTVPLLLCALVITLAN